MRDEVKALVEAAEAVVRNAGDGARVRVVAADRIDALRAALAAVRETEAVVHWREGGYDFAPPLFTAHHGNKKLFVEALPHDEAEDGDHWKWWVNVDDIFDGKQQRADTLDAAKHAAERAAGVR